jgi:hypothetical protein
MNGVEWVNELSRVGQYMIHHSRRRAASEMNDEQLMTVHRSQYSQLLFDPIKGLR